MSVVVPQTDNELLIHAVEAAPDGVLIVDDHGTIVYANRSMQHLTGVGELIGRNVDEFVPPEMRDRHTSLRERYNAHPVARHMGAGRELALRRADGTDVPVEISLSPSDRAGRHVVATVRDISDRHQARRRLDAADHQLALAEERERIGRDLHDVVLQRLYGMGLTVQAISNSADGDVTDRLERVVDDIDRIISEVRTIVFALGHSVHHGALGNDLADVVAQASRMLGFRPSIRLDGPVESVLSNEIQTEMVSSMREALSNVARHASASRVDVTLAVRADRVVLTVVDDGVGPPDDPSRLAAGNGLVNLRSRAEAFGGGAELSAGAECGAVLTWSVRF